MNNLEVYLKLTQKAVSEIQLPKTPALLYEPMQYILSLGGKRMRPVLTLMSCNAFGKPAEQSMNAALAVELFHNFSLIHDDIMDAAPLRRGKATVHTKWNTHVGILSGDGMLIEAYKKLNTYSPVVSHALIEVFNKTATEVCEGQQLDMDFEKRSDVTLKEYIEMIRLKTSVLLGCSLQFGAIVAQRDLSDQEKIYQFGVNLGISFQIQDDLLDLYGDSTKVGKQTGGDILANKKTFLVLKAFEQADQRQKEALQTMLTENNPEKKLAAAKRCFEQLNIKTETKSAIKYYHDIALKNLREIKISDEARQPLEELAAFLLNRDH
ncbi:MAG: polyprenyl synthetase family protein [Crocinitomicaceae bacterium]|nr:polyprenyl synthetase family protein [Crocinitomicaceae bacterium]